MNNSKKELVKRVHELPYGFRLSESRYRWPDVGPKEDWVDKNGNKLWACEITLWWSFVSPNWGNRLNGELIKAWFSGITYSLGKRGVNITKAETDDFVNGVKDEVERVLSGEKVIPWGK